MMTRHCVCTDDLHMITSPEGKRGYWFVCLCVCVKHLYTHRKIFIERLNHLTCTDVLCACMCSLYLCGVFVFMRYININKVYYVHADVSDACPCLCTCTVCNCVCV